MKPYLLIIHKPGDQPATACCRAVDRTHAKIIGLHDGLHRGMVSKVEAIPLHMKPQNHYSAAQLTLAL